ncbi:hypothetical protein J6590_006108 [Homalodisca vitripennis]|nr:hypothetical protein J6590_006108 [Homalodisca vitripennis]
MGEIPEQARTRCGDPNLTSPPVRSKADIVSTTSTRRSIEGRKGMKLSKYQRGAMCE